MKRKTIDIITLGCSKNLVDSEQLMRQLEEAGYDVTHDSEKPTGEIAVINTCGFIGDAKEESINMILEFAQEKEEGNLEKLFVMGCLSERYLKELAIEIPQVDKFYGKFDWKGLLQDLGKVGIINQDTHAGWLPTIGDNSYLLNIIIVALIVVILFVYLRYSKHGYEISVVGESENTARYIGINVKRVIIRTMAFSGAICGVAGLLLVGGTHHTIATTTADGRGFTAIMVSWLAKFNPIYMILTSFLLVFLERGAGEIATVFKLNESFSDIISGIILFFIIGSEFFINYRIMHRSAGKENRV